MHDHLSWAYEDRGDFVRRVQEFLTDGLALGMRCMFTADGQRAALEADLAGIPELHAALDRGALVINTTRDLYDEDAVVDPERLLPSIAAAVEDALAQGYAGLRIAADVTPLIRTEEQLAAFAAWEHAVDRYASGHALSGMCAFDRTQVPASATVVLAGMHPLAREGTAPFGVFTPDGEADLGVAGEVDGSVTDEFRTCLRRTRLGDGRRELLVDGSRLSFVDHRGLQSLSELAAHDGATVVLHTTSGVPERLIALLGLEGIRAVRAETATTEGAAG